MVSSSPYDWRVNPNDALWANESSTNNPCPQGYRVPTEAEQTALVTDASITNYTNAASSNLAFAAAGNRYLINAALGGQAFGGYYWSSTVSGNNPSYRYFTSSSTVVILAAVQTASLFVALKIKVHWFPR